MYSGVITNEILLCLLFVKLSAFQRARTLAYHTTIRSVALGAKVAGHCHLSPANHDEP